jgi:protein ImuB
MGQAAMATARHLSLPLRIGIAANKLAARVAARQPSPPTVVPPGEEAAFLAPLPVHHLQLGRRMAGTLERWGITTMGELARLPADQVASRLGLDGSRLHQAAQGLDAEPLVPHHPPAVLAEGMELEWPVLSSEPLLYAVRQALERLAGRLEPYGLACTLLELELGLEPEGIDRRPIHLPAPTRDLDALLSLVRLEIESRPPSAPVASFTCLAHPDQPRRGQLTLFGPAELDPDRLATTLARLGARLGTDRLGSPRTVDGHLPERFACPAFDPPPAPRLRRPPRRGLGLLAVRVLRPPIELEVLTEPLSATSCRRPSLPAEPAPPVTSATMPASSSAGTSRPANGSATSHPEPLRLLSVSSPPGAAHRIQGRIRIAAGPWNLRTSWWTTEPVERDYWDIELSTGGLYRIYRDRTTNDWFADGVYD